MCKYLLLMKKISFILIFSLLCLVTFGQSFAQQKEVYANYGTFEKSYDNNKISVSAFVTIEGIVDTIYNSKSDDINVASKYTIDSLYQYNVYLESKSTYNGDTTSTWLYGVKVLVNNNDVMSNQFPDGFMLSVKTTPTLVYTYQSKKTDNKFNVKWEKSVYEPRIRK